MLALRNVSEDKDKAALFMFMSDSLAPAEASAVLSVLRRNPWDALQINPHPAPLPSDGRGRPQGGFRQRCGTRQ